MFNFQASEAEGLFLRVPQSQRHAASNRAAEVAGSLGRQAHGCQCRWNCWLKAASQGHWWMLKRNQRGQAVMGAETSPSLQVSGGLLVVISCCSFAAVTWTKVKDGRAFRIAGCEYGAMRTVYVWRAVASKTRLRGHAPIVGRCGDPMPCCWQQL